MCLGLAQERGETLGLDTVLPTRQGLGSQISPAQSLLGVQAELTVDIPRSQLHDAVGKGGWGRRTVICEERAGPSQSVPGAGDEAPQHHPLLPGRGPIQGSSPSDTWGTAGSRIGARGPSFQFQLCHQHTKWPWDSVRGGSASPGTTMGTADWTSQTLPHDTCEVSIPSFLHFH